MNDQIKQVETIEPKPETTLEKMRAGQEDLGEKLEALRAVSKFSPKVPMLAGDCIESAVAVLDQVITGIEEIENTLTVAGV